VGIWAPGVQACIPRPDRRGPLQAVITPAGAQAGETTCAFRNGRRTGAEAWTVTATCADPRKRWTTRVTLTARGDRLTWSSRQGSQTYVRCGAPGGLLRAHQEAPMRAQGQETPPRGRA
jgi:hypothetical protein